MSHAPAHRVSSHKPICAACNRPFDPSSPGATRTMGPTCAKRSAQVTLDESGPQLSFLTASEADPVPSTERRGSKKNRNAALATPKVPRALCEKYLLAKVAFDELQRRCFANASILHGKDAYQRYQALRARKEMLEHSLKDPSLEWLEPEHDNSLLVDHSRRETYLLRVLNGIWTLLEIAPADRATASDHLATILDYSQANQAFRRNVGEQQLSLLATRGSEAPQAR